MREFNDLGVAGHVIDREVVPAVADEDEPLGLDEVWVREVVQASVVIVMPQRLVLDQGVTADRAGVQARKELQGLLQLVEGPLIELRLAYPVEYLLVGCVDAEVQLGWDRF